MFKPMMAAGVALAAFASPAAGQWYKATTPRFVVYSEQGEKAVRDLATELDRFDSAMRLVRGIPPGTPGDANRLTVYQVKNEAAIEQLANSDGVAGFYRPGAATSAAFVPADYGKSKSGELSPQVVLQHEYAHHFMFRHFSGGYPLWMTEGFAEFNATAGTDRDGNYRIGEPVLHRSYEFSRLDPIPVRRMMDPPASLRTFEVLGMYTRGWLLTHYLTMSPDREGQYDAYVNALNAGKPAGAAAEAAFGDLNKLDHDLTRYQAKRPMAVLVINPDKLNAGPVTVTRMSAAESAAMPIRVVSRSGVDRSEALDLLPRARRMATPYPNDAFVQSTLAEAEYDAGNYRQARDAAARAVAADPDWQDGLIYLGMATERVARAGKTVDAEQMQRARDAYRQANRHDPDDPRPVMLLYRSLQRQGPVQSEALHDALDYAQMLAPEDRDLRMYDAVEHLRRDDLTGARKLLYPIVFNPHGGGKSMAADFVRLIDAGDRAGIVAKIAEYDGEVAEAETKAES